MITEGNLYYKEFLSALQNKISHKTTLANTVTDLLAIDKDAVYRRLRGEVNFSFAEMSVIAKNLGISLDKIAGIENVQTKPTTMNITRAVNPIEEDYQMFEIHVNRLKSIKDETDTRIMQARSSFPNYIYLNYANLTKYFMFIWNQSSGYGEACPYHQIRIPERLRSLQIDVCRYARQVKSTTYIFDYRIFQMLVSNINYFFQIGLLKDEDVLVIKTDLTALLNYLETMAIKGLFEDTGNKVSMYITDINFDLNYSCLKSKNIQLTHFWTFLLNVIISLDEVVFHEATAWIYSLQRMSTLISVSGEKIRAEFFNNQRKIIETL